jgi:hypothetical protein
MPDRHGFNLLGDSVRCIDCETRGPICHWPERKPGAATRPTPPRRRHRGKHDRTPATTDAPRPAAGPHPE